MLTQNFEQSQIKIRKDLLKSYGWSQCLSNTYIIVFGIILFGTLCLPMLPIWQGGIHLLVAFMLVTIFPKTATRIKLGVPLFILLAMVGFGWVKSLIDNPVGHLIHSLTDIYGQPLGIIPGLAILLFELISLPALTYLLVKNPLYRGTEIYIFISMCFAFWFWSFISLVNHLVLGVGLVESSQMMVGFSQWTTWIYMALLPLLIVRNQADLRFLLGGISLSITFVGVLILIQKIVGDYSYILDAFHFQDYFYRVRGTAYYHASAVFIISLGFMFIITCFKENENKKTMYLLGMVALLFVVFLNNTRGVSIALLAGAGVAFIVAVRHKKLAILSVSLLAMIVISSSILYVKPISGQDSSKLIESEVENLDVEPETEHLYIDPGLGEVVVANSSRLLLLSSGLKYLQSVLWFGSGIGILELPLEGTAFNGILSTYSTHTIYLDIALMVGLPGIILFLGIFSLSAGVCAYSTLVCVNSRQSYVFIGLFGALVIFLVGSLFFPQERNNLVGVGFFIASIILVVSRINEADAGISIRFQKYLFFLLLLGVLGWGLVTSPSYIFPIIEFVARYGKEIADSDSKVGVTNPMLRPMLSALLKLRGVKNPDIFVLKDDPKQLPLSNTWILWSPSFDYEYPKLRKSMGYQSYRQGNVAPSIGLPDSWWVLSSAQPVVMFLYVGARPEIIVSKRKVIRAICGNNLFSDELKKTLQDNIIQSNANLMEKRNYSSHLGRGICEDFINENKSTQATHSGLIIDHESSDGGIRISTLPNYAGYADILLLDTDSSSQGRDIADLNYGTAIKWNAYQGIDILFDVGNGIKLGVYRIQGLVRRDISYSRHYSWDIFSSNDRRNWVPVGKEYNQILSAEPGHLSSYLVLSNKKYKYYLFRFLPLNLAPNIVSGVMEIELYPLEN